MAYQPRSGELSNTLVVVVVVPRTVLPRARAVKGAVGEGVILDFPRIYRSLEPRTPVVAVADCMNPTHPQASVPEEAGL